MIQGEIVGAEFYNPILLSENDGRTVIHVAVAPETRVGHDEVVLLTIDDYNALAEQATKKGR